MAGAQPLHQHRCPHINMSIERDLLHAGFMQSEFSQLIVFLLVSSYILFTGNYKHPFYFRPFLPCCQPANLRLGKFQCSKVSLKTQVCSANLRRGEIVFKC